ncbi:MAG: hypothetical protein JOZ77_05295 [Candidatus Eremiobacteraeota bacterium]|nr:hypothetical protein [Candidatus Eremiobacteraeota bacterium]
MRTCTPLVAALAASVLAACGGSFAHIGPTTAVDDARARASSEKPLLYVSDIGTSTVYVYTYPENVLVGTLKLSDPEGECADAAGNVYIVEEAARILEFHHGGATPTAILKAPSNHYPVSCAVNPTNGDLAVAVLATGIGKDLGPGEVLVYTRARGKPRKFSARNLYSYYFLGYDNAGNLFVDGSDGRPGVNVRFEYAELPSGEKKMAPLTLSGGSIAFPGNVQWDGEHITIGDQFNAVIYQTQGAHIVGSTPLTGSSDVVGYFIDGGVVICPDSGNSSVEFYNYPAGGMATGRLTGFSRPVGAVISP